MTEYWPWWLSGLALAAVPAINWLAVGRMMAVSGRFTALIDRIRFGPTEEPEMTTAELIEAIRLATLEATGADALPAAGGSALADGGTPLGAAEAAALPKEPDLPPAPRRPQTLPMHGAFLLALVIGGLLGASTKGQLAVGHALAGDGFAGAFGPSRAGQAAVLLVGGMLVGAGARMAGGCTSGHGLCGVSRLQRGSLLATASFFASGVLTALLLDWL